MTFNLEFPAQIPEVSRLQLEPGEMMFVLGANGTGKSSLLFRFTQQNKGRVRKIAAHRQTWMNTEALDMTPAEKIETEKRLRIDKLDGNHGIEINTLRNVPAWRFTN